MCSQGRTEKLKRERGKLRKINSFREILNNMSKKGEGVRRTAPPLLERLWFCAFGIPFHPLSLNLVDGLQDSLDALLLH